MESKIALEQHYYGGSFDYERWMIQNSTIPFTKKSFLFNQKVKSGGLYEEINKIYNLIHIGFFYYTNKNKDFILRLIPTNTVGFENYNVTDMNIIHLDTFDIKSFYDSIVVKHIKVEDDSYPNFNLITLNQGKIDYINRKLDFKINVDLDNSYNTSFPIGKVIDILNSDKSGLLLLSGNPGTGKSYLIKYLTQLLSKKDFFYLPNNCLYILSDPNFTSFCLNFLKDSILVIEDCELALRSRDKVMSGDISTILNITDGIIGDMLNLKVIATLNTVDKIDTALLRKGRMLANCEFKPLTIEQAKNTAKILNKDIDIITELCLCDIYNAEDNGVKEIIKTKIGY